MSETSVEDLQVIRDLYVENKDLSRKLKQCEEACSKQDVILQQVAIKSGYDGYPDNLSNHIYREMNALKKFREEVLVK